MGYFTIREILFSPFRTVRRLATSAQGALAAGRAVLSDLVDARDREITARERFRKGLNLDGDSLARPGVLRYSREIVKAAIRDLGRASYFWQKILISCKVDYETWLALEEAIRNAQEIDNAIDRAIQNGNYDEAESLFDKAMEYKLTAIKLAKSYLENLKSA